MRQSKRRPPSILITNPPLSCGVKECCEIRPDLPDLQLSTIMELYGNDKNWATGRGENPLSKKRWEGQAEALHPSCRVTTGREAASEGCGCGCLSRRRKECCKCGVLSEI